VRRRAFSHAIRERQRHWAGQGPIARERRRPALRPTLLNVVRAMPTATPGFAMAKPPAQATAHANANAAVKGRQAAMKRKLEF